MKGTRAAKRYAGALLDLSAEMKKTDPVAADMVMIHDWVSSSHELKSFLLSPIIDRARKKKAVEALFKGKVDELTEHFLYLLVDKERESLTDQIAVEFKRLYDDLLGIGTAKVRAPFRLDSAEGSKVQSTLEVLTGKKIRLSFSIDRSLVGGFLAQIGDTVYDGSVRRQLELIGQKLINN